MKRAEAKREIQAIQDRHPHCDPRLQNLTFGEICALAVRQIETDKRKPDYGRRIAEIRQRFAAITKGPWFAGKAREDDNGTSMSITVGTFEAAEHFEDTICEVWDGNHIAGPNADFIAHAPDDIAYLLGL